MPLTTSELAKEIAAVTAKVTAACIQCKDNEPNPARAVRLCDYHTCPLHKYRHKHGDDTLSQ